MKPTLLVLAAGMGSRYGGLKQLDGVGPSGETIMDYSVYDALNAGFGKIVFVIRESFADDFQRIVISKYKEHIEIEVVYQELDKLPEGFTLDPAREKPWGTNHAIMMAAPVINEPFAVINADDFYGKKSYETLAKQLQTLEGKKGDYCMIGYRLCNTLSESGSVSRGVCEVDSNNLLTKVTERTDIVRKPEGIQYKDADNSWHTLADDVHVSMNMWGFTPEYFAYSNDFFKTFLKENEGKLRAEYYIPTLVDSLITSKKATVKVLDTTETWFGVTYPEDRADVVGKLKKLVDAGVYPSPLF